MRFSTNVLLAAAATAPIVAGAPVVADTRSTASNPPTKFGVALFDDFQALDVFGPVDVLNMLSHRHNLQQYILASTLDPVSTRYNGNEKTLGQSVIPTHTFDDAPEDLEVLLVPGGLGAWNLQETAPVVDFIKAQYPNLRYLLTVCTGSAITARTGILDGKKATSNKSSFEWVKTQGPNVDWVQKARWVNDDNVWTSSGVSAGIDMMYAFIADQWGEDTAKDVAVGSEYIRNTDPNYDPFAR